MREVYSRREVNRALLVSAISLAAAGVPIVRQGMLHLFDFAIAGGHFHALLPALARMCPGMELMLRREPDNPHDTNAVAVHLGDGTKLGFIPRVANEAVARLLDRGERLDARVLRLLPVLHGWADIPDDLVFTSVASGDPVIRLTHG